MGGFVVTLMARVGMVLAEAIVARLAQELYTYVRSRYTAAATA